MQKFLKLIEISCLQLIKGKLTIIPYCSTCFTHTCQLCVPTIVVVSLKIFFFTPGSLQVGRVEDHRMMFTWHLYLLQSYIQAVLYICITDNMMSFTLYTLISECIFSILFSIHFLKFWQGEFVLQSQVLQLIIISLFL